MPFSFEMQHLPSPLHDGLEFASLSFLPANTMSREKSRAEIEKVRGRSGLVLFFWLAFRHGGLFE